MPDFDIDFCYVRRGEVIDYVTQKYGADHVAQIVTFGTLATKAAIRDVGRAMGMPYAAVDAVAKLVPNDFHITIEQAVNKSKELSSLMKENAQINELIETAKKVEGMPRNTSTHASGVVITHDPVSSYVPLATNDGVPVTQYIMTSLEELGLLKMDFLGLRTLTVIDNASKSAGIDINNIAIDDEKSSHLSLQLMLDEYMTVLNDKCSFYHKGSIGIGKIGSGKISELRELVYKRYPKIIKNNRFYFGTLTNNKLWHLDDKDVVELIENLISYVLIRDEYREIVKRRKIQMEKKK